jgi:hypothetical protein
MPTSVKKSAKAIERCSPSLKTSDGLCWPLATVNDLLVSPARGVTESVHGKLRRQRSKLAKKSG